MLGRILVLRDGETHSGAGQRGGMAPAKLVGEDEALDTRTDILKGRLEHVHRDLTVGENLFDPVKYGDAEICFSGTAEFRHAVGFQRQDLFIVGVDRTEMKPVLLRRDSDLMEGELEEIFSRPVGGDVHGPPATAARNRRRRSAEEERGIATHGTAGTMDLAAKRRAVSPRKRNASARFCCPERSEGRSSMER